MFGDRLAGYIDEILDNGTIKRRRVMLSSLGRFRKHRKPHRLIGLSPLWVFEKPGGYIVDYKRRFQTWSMEVKK